MPDTLLTKLRRNIRTTAGQINGVIDSAGRGDSVETKRLLETLKRAITRVGDDAEAAINDQCELLRLRCRTAQSQLANERYRKDKHRTTELVEHAIRHARDIAEWVNMDDWGTEVRATMMLLDILLNESNGIAPPGCGNVGNDHQVLEMEGLGMR